MNCEFALNIAYLRIKLLGEASTLPGKRIVNQTMAVVIERSGDNVGSLLKPANTRSYPISPP